MHLDPSELTRRIREGEGARLEFKSGLPAAWKIARTLAAFANSRGGLLLVGIGDDRSILGAPDPEEALETVARVAREDVEPPLQPSLEVVSLEAPGGPKRILACWQPKSRQGPHRVLTLDGVEEFPVRVGASNRSASGATRRALVENPGPNPQDPLQVRVLDWVANRPTERRGGGNGATAAAFAQDQNIGFSRARRAFIALERAGHLFGTGNGNERFYCLP